MATEKDIAEYWGGKTPKMEGDKVKIGYLVDKEITILDAEIRPSKFGEGKTFALIQIEREGKKEVVMTAAAAVQGSLKFLLEKGALPGRVKCKVVRETAITGRDQYKLETTKVAPTKPEPKSSPAKQAVEKKGRKRRGKIP